MITLTAKIYISDTEVIEIDKSNLLSMSSSIFDRSDLKLPNFGVISNVGEIEFNDNDGKVLEYAGNLQLVEGLQCEIWLTNTLEDNATELVAKLETAQWNYDNNNKVVTVSLKDDLQEWQNVNVEGIPYDPRTNQTIQLKYIYEYLWEITSSLGYNIVSFSELDDTTQYILSSTYIKYKLLNKANLWRQWTKLCEVSLLHIYKDNQGKIVCRYNGGN